MNAQDTPSIEGQWQHLARSASRMQFLQTRPPGDPLASWFGRARMALPDEDWPRFGNRLAWPLLQVNCRELPYRPDTLSDIEFLTLFVDPADPLPTVPVAPNGEHWLLRTYSSISELVPLDEPALQPVARPGNPRYPVPPPRAKPVAWTFLPVDYPASETLMNLPNWREYESIEDDERLVPSEGTKVGGWPFPVQSDPWEAVDIEHIIQIDSHYEAGWNWGDNGMAFLGRRIDDPDTWVLTWQCL